MDSGFRGISEEFLHFKRGRNCSTCMYALVMTAHTLTRICSALNRAAVGIIFNVFVAVISKEGKIVLNLIIAHKELT
jgi:hypothetical protein